MYKLTCVLAIGVACWLAYEVFDLQIRMEAGVVEEAWLRGQRDFLLTLPQLLHASDSRETFVSTLRERYPETLIQEQGSNLCWGSLKLQFPSSNSLDLLEVKENCN